MSLFRVLLVCTANHCRSPIAEQVLTTACDELFGVANTWSIESAGTDVRFDMPMHRYAAQVLAGRPDLIEEHRSRQLDLAMVRSADLILTAAREHRSVVVSLLPAAIGRTFTVLQFARLAAAVGPIESKDPGDLGRILLADAKSARSTLQPVPTQREDLPDPMGGPPAAFEECATTLTAAIATILRPLQLIDPRSVRPHRV